MNHLSNSNRCALHAVVCNRNGLESKTKILSLLIAAGLSGLSQAQTQPAAQQTEEVIVTATRIARTGFTAPTPTTSIGAQDLEARATTNVTNILYELPAVVPNLAGNRGSQNAGGNNVNLRGLGANRTLVLVDGVRFVPTTIAGLVDANVVPNALVQRVDIVTGGASAAWGSDAVSGVVNFIFKKEISGFQGNIQYGSSFHNDDKTKSIALAWGTEFGGGNGQFMVAGEYSKQDDSQTEADRDWSNKHTRFVNSVVNGLTVTRTRADNVTLSQTTYGGVIITATGAPLAATSPLRTLTGGNGVQFGAGSTIQPFRYGTNLSNTTMVGGDGPFYMDQLQMIPDTERKTLYGRATYDFSSSVRGSADASLLQSNNRYFQFPIYVPNTDAVINIAADNAFLQTLPGLATLRTALGNTGFAMGRIIGETGFANYDIKNETKRFVAALNGDFGESGHWKLNYTHGVTDYDFKFNNALIEPNFRAAVDSVVENGQIICRINSTTAANQTLLNARNALGQLTYAGAGAAPGCVPVNLFGAGSITPAMLQYFMGTQVFHATYKQDAASASISHEPFSTWAGKVSTTAGIEYRKESVSGTSDLLSQGIAGTTYANGAYQTGNPKPLKGSFETKEFFAEAVVPLLSKVVFADALDLNAAFRNTNYSTSGEAQTWKLGLTYKPVSGLLLRGTRSHDIRAPNLNELYQSSGIQAASLTVLANGAATSGYLTSQLSVGNPNLKPEIGDTKTMGFTWQPNMVKGLQFSIDGYSIKLKKAITTVTAANIVNGCFGLQGNAVTPAYCAFITPGAGSGAVPITSVTSAFLNLNAINTRGVDYEVSYRFPLNQFMGSVPGAVNLRYLATNLKSLITDNGVTRLDTAGQISSSLPKWRSSLSATYDNGPWVVFAQARYVGKGLNTNTFVTGVDIDDNHIASITYVDTSVQYTIKNSVLSRLQVYGKISNLLDRDPPIIVQALQNFAPANGALYDMVGRAFSVGLRFEY